AGRLHFIQAQPAPAGGDVRNAALDLERAVIGAAAADRRRAKDPDALAAECREGARVGRKRAHYSRELLGGATGVELSLSRIELRRKRHLTDILWTADELSIEIARQLSLEKLGAELREPCFELAAVLGRRKLRPGLREDRTRIQVGGSLHQRRARLGIARKDRVRNRSGAAPSREQRRVNVHGAPGHPIEQRLWDPVAVRRPDEQLGTEREQRRDRFRIEP